MDSRTLGNTELLACIRAHLPQALPSKSGLDRGDPVRPQVLIGDLGSLRGWVSILGSHWLKDAIIRETCFLPLMLYIRGE
jgi:hypothetical protein